MRNKLALSENHLLAFAQSRFYYSDFHSVPFTLCPSVVRVSLDTIFHISHHIKARCATRKSVKHEASEATHNVRSNGNLSVKKFFKLCELKLGNFFLSFVIAFTLAFNGNLCRVVACLPDE